MSKKLPIGKSFGVEDINSDILGLVNEDIAKTFGAKSLGELNEILELANDIDLRQLCFQVGVSTMGNKESLRERIRNEYSKKERQAIGSLSMTNPEPIKLKGTKKQLRDAEAFLKNF